jgi:hypothetical protein
MSGSLAVGCERLHLEQDEGAAADILQKRGQHRSDYPQLQ